MTDMIDREGRTDDVVDRIADAVDDHAELLEGHDERIQTLENQPQVAGGAAPAAAEVKPAGIINVTVTLQGDERWFGQVQKGTLLSDILKAAKLGSSPSAKVGDEVLSPSDPVNEDCEVEATSGTAKAG